jgi:serine/threonine-protein kinase
MFAGALVAWHNLRLGRGDRRGATRLALFVFIMAELNWIASTHHIPDIGPEFNSFMDGLADTMLFVALCWIMYVALEQLVRRRWPGRIISWTRFLGGDFRDPLVGRDILIGGLLGLGLVLTFYFWNLAPGWLGRPPYQPANIDIDTLLGFRRFVSVFSNTVLQELIQALGFMFLLLLLYIVLRKEWLAVGAGWLMLAVALFFMGFDPAVDWFFAAISAAIIITALVRFGLLATGFLFFFANTLWFLPITSDFSSWYAWSTILILFMLLALTTYGFIISLGGQKLSVANLLQD